MLTSKRWGFLSVHTKSHRCWFTTMTKLFDGVQVRALVLFNIRLVQGYIYMTCFVHWGQSCNNRGYSFPWLFPANHKDSISHSTNVNDLIKWSRILDWIMAQKIVLCCGYEAFTLQRVKVTPTLLEPFCGDFFSALGQRMDRIKKPSYKWALYIGSSFNRHKMSLWY